MKTYYAPTFLDESRTYPDKRGNSRPTGKLSGAIMTRSFFRQGNKIKASRGVHFFSWKVDTDDAKATSLKKVIEGMEEMPELDSNPPLTYIPSHVAALLSNPEEK